MSWRQCAWVAVVCGGCAAWERPGPVWVEGCFAMHEGVCLPGPAPFFDDAPQTLRLWVPDVPTARVRVEGGEVDGEVRAVDGGAALTVRLPPDASLLTVRWGGRLAPQSWQLPLRRWPTVLTEAAALGEHAKSIQAVDDGLETLSSLDQALALRITALWRRDQGDDLQGDIVDRLVRALSLQEEGGARRDARATEIHLGYEAEHSLGLPRDVRISAPSPDVDRTMDISDAFAASWAALQAARWSGFYRDALLHVDELKIYDRRVMGGGYAAYYQSQEGELAELLGDHDASIALHRAAVPASEECKAWAAPAHAYAMSLQRAREREHPVPAPDEVRKTLDRVADCAPDHLDAAFAADVFIDAARVAVFEERLEDARAWLEQYAALLRRSGATPRHVTQLDAHRVTAELAAAMGQHARVITETQAALSSAEAWERPLSQMAMQVLRADALAAQGRRDEAVEAYQTMHDGWVAQGPLVPLERGRGGFLSVAARALHPYVQLLVDAERASEAMDVLRRARLQLLAGLQIAPLMDAADAGDTATWRDVRADVESLITDRAALERELVVAPLSERPALLMQMEALQSQVRDLMDDALASYAPHYLGQRRAPERDEALVTWSDHRGRRVVFSRTTRGVQAVSVQADEPEALQEAIRGILDADSELQRLTFLPTPGDEVSWPATSWADGGLLRRAAVSWSLDLHRVAATPSTNRRALVVGDPRGDLVDARAEAEEVSALLRASGWDVVELRGDEATRDAVLSQLEQVGLFHFAGHGEFASRRREPWSAGLMLAGTDQLDVRDVLLLDAVPELVVLSGCDTARSTDLDVEDLGLAQAFLTRGTAAVLGTTDDVASDLAKDVATEFHAELQRADDVHTAYRRTMLAMSEAGVGSELGAFRLLTP